MFVFSCVFLVGRVIGGMTRVLQRFGLFVLVVGSGLLYHFCRFEIRALKFRFSLSSRLLYT
jgi:hypothetical protein